jgi:hypothetical protein
VQRKLLYNKVKDSWLHVQIIDCDDELVFILK